MVTQLLKVFHSPCGEQQEKLWFCLGRPSKLFIIKVHLRLGTDTVRLQPGGKAFIWTADPPLTFAACFFFYQYKHMMTGKGQWSRRGTSCRVGQGDSDLGLHWNFGFGSAHLALIPHISSLLRGKEKKMLLVPYRSACLSARFRPGSCPEAGIFPHCTATAEEWAGTHSPSLTWIPLSDIWLCISM